MNDLGSGANKDFRASFPAAGKVKIFFKNRSE